MIFVTVGTHEQPFDRLLLQVDKWAETSEEEVIMQTGFTDFKPKNAKWKKMMTACEMQDYFNNARIVITHGGPSSFMPLVLKGEIPIVVPRKFELCEHVNNHQVIFCNEFQKKYGGIIVIDDITEIDNYLNDFENKTKHLKNSFKSNNENFCIEFARIVESLFVQGK